MPKQIALTRGRVALVDDDVFEWADAHNWGVTISGYTYYAIRRGPRPERRTILLHRQIMMPPPGMIVDHIDGDGLNCTRQNMRVCTHSENHYNQRIRSDNTSGFKGVSWNSGMKKWVAYIHVDGKMIVLGYFSDAPDAAIAYDTAALRYYGSFAKTNF